MREKIEFTPNYGVKTNNAIIKVIGVGGGGGNAVKHMYSEGIVGVDFLICNTDRQVLEANQVPSKLVLGESGLGAGAKPEVARDFALNSKEQIIDFIGTETKMLFITAGMGKGTGTGAAPVIAQIAQEMGILTIGVVTFPFKFEGKIRAKYAEDGIEELKKYVDSLIVVKNQNIIKFFGNEDIDAAFGYADDVLKNAVKCIAELITVKADQNIDFKDIETVMKNSGPAMLGLATARGENRIEQVVEDALSCSLLDQTLITEAKNFLFFISYGKEIPLKIAELEAITEKFESYKSESSDVIWGRALDESLGDAIKLSVIITNYKTEEKPVETTLTEATVLTEPDQTEERLPGSMLIEFDPADMSIRDDHDLIKEQTTPPVANVSSDPFAFIGNAYTPEINSEELLQTAPAPSLSDLPSITRIPAADYNIARQTSVISQFNEEKFEDNNAFADLTNTPAILRKRMADHEDLQTLTLEQNQPNFEIEDDMNALFKNRPD